MTNYDRTFEGVDVIMTRKYANTLGEVISKWKISA